MSYGLRFLQHVVDSTRIDAETAPHMVGALMRWQAAPADGHHMYVSRK